MSIAGQNSPDRVVLTPSQLNSDIRQALERGFPPLWVEGEISNLAQPRSGHLYFSLKDADSQIGCAMFRNRNQLLRFRPENGQQVLVRARITVYEPRGQYQLLVESMEPAGEGALRAAFDRLKAKLEAEGLFAPERKRALPVAPQRIGIITSPSGAAIRDILTTLERRFPLAEVVVYPTAVQGNDAPRQIIHALDAANRRAECDVLIVGRGGGSLEDLMAFNDEGVARALAASEIPTISGVGHETDFTIADFVADLRAPTPTGAAERVAPDIRDWLRTLATLRDGLTAAAQRQLARRNERLQWVRRRLQQQHPGQQLRQQAQRLDELEARLQRGMETGLRDRRQALARLRAEFREHHPGHRIARQLDHVNDMGDRLARRTQEQLRHRGQRLQELSRALNAVSPLATLGRGYAILGDAQTDHVITHIEQATPGQRITARLQDGQLEATVEKLDINKD
ncbi:MAG: exodeoxyribonuclease VII large subunit [Gammaproteobacteria bacterium]|nr:exodeoxyribonuclease VII large subunit [Gammaproteobacteria bacterium]